MADGAGRAWSAEAAGGPKPLLPLAPINAHFFVGSTKTFAVHHERRWTNPSSVSRFRQTVLGMHGRHKRLEAQNLELMATVSDLQALMVQLSDNNRCVAIIIIIK
jgi:hypothetical protein